MHPQLPTSQGRSRPSVKRSRPVPPAGDETHRHAVTIEQPAPALDIAPDVGLDLPLDLPADLRRDAFAPPAMPWLSDSCLPFAPAVSHGFAVGDAVRLLTLPPALAQLPRPTRRRLGRMVGELFEVYALPLPDQLMLARRIQARGQQGLQILYVPPECVERAIFAAHPAPSAARTQ